MSVIPPSPLPQLTADDLRWTSDPIPRDETIDVLTLTEAETVRYARALQHDNRLLRQLLHEALAIAARLTQRAEAYRVRLSMLVRELREIRRRREVH